MTSQTAPASAIPRAVLEDRYDGLLVCVDGRYPHAVAKSVGGNPIGEYSRLQLRLDRVITALAEGIARCDLTEAPGDIVGDAESVLRDFIVQRVHELGLAR